MHHGRSRSEIQNLGFVVEAGGKTFLHVGDTELTLDEWRALDLPSYEIDLALLPAWQVSEEKLAAIGAKRVAAFHLARPDAPKSWFGPYGSLDERVAALKQVEGVEVLFEPGEQLVVGGEK